MEVLSFQRKENAQQRREVSEVSGNQKVIEL
jgi:hypothetical protein